MMKRFILIFLLGTPAFPRVVSLHPPESTIANFPTCDGSYAGSKLRIATDNDSGDCVTSSGTGDAVCWCDGVGPWAPLGDGSIGNSLDTELIFNNSGTEDGSLLTTDGTDITLGSGLFLAPTGSTSGYSFAGFSTTLWAMGTANELHAMVSAGKILEINASGITMSSSREVNASTTGDGHAFSGDGNTSLAYISADTAKLQAGGNCAVAFSDIMTPQACPVNALDDSTSHQLSVEMATGQAVNALQVRDFSGNVDLAVTAAGVLLASVPHGALEEEDIDGTPGSTISITTAGTYYPWITATAGSELVGITADVADATGDNLDVNTGMGGVYLVELSMSFSGSVSTRINCFVFDSGARTAIGFTRKLGTGGDVGSAGSGSRLYRAAAGDEFSVRCTADGNSKTISLWGVSLSMYRIGA